MATPVASPSPHLRFERTEGMVTCSIFLFLTKRKHFINSLTVII
jgi:hypothetical protein